MTGPVYFIESDKPSYEQPHSNQVVVPPKERTTTVHTGIYFSFSAMIEDRIRQMKLSN